MRFDVLTLFPAMFDAITQQGISQRAHDEALFQLHCWNPRDYAIDNYKRVDDRPYGGGPGMVMMPSPLTAALEAAKTEQKNSPSTHRPHLIYLSPQGQLLTHRRTVELAQYPHLILLAGRYEGIDERFLLEEVDEEISIGDYVLSGGELPAMVLIDAIIRHLPGALGNPASAQQESLADDLLEYPHYTRPEVYYGMAVPEVLRSGNHAAIAQWRLKHALGRTWLRRPELLEKRQLTQEENRLLAAFQARYYALPDNTSHELYLE